MHDAVPVIAIFGCIPLVIWIIMSQRNKAKAKTAEIITSLIGKDKDVTPEIIKAIGYVPARSHGDLRTSLILMALGAALFILGGVIPEEEAQQIFAGFSAFPFLIGIALLAFWFFISRHENN
ncbi:MAG: hypothetical protein COA43_07810 [Robiginitomaculum sp.]|nr:MAG: hypothetical protein COA43_07810 [Robiginitomaculum sp.]